MGKVGLAVCVLAGCGRLGFDPFGSGDATLDKGDGLSDGTLDDGTPGPSCASLDMTCGPSGKAPCCRSPLVPGGSFARSYDVSGDVFYPDMSHPATIDAFRLDVYEVTVGRFRAFVNAGYGTQQNPPAVGAGGRTLGGMPNQGGWSASFTPSLVANTTALVAAVKCQAALQSWTDSPGANENLPINCITWFEAMAFCTWDGGFLPTEAEWNYVAAGGSEQRAYPWSSPPSSVTIDCSYAKYYNGVSFCVTNAVSPVGSRSPKGDGRWGQADLAGNVEEMTLDWYGAYDDPCDDCWDFTPSADRVLRGGDFSGDESFARVGSRGLDTPTSRGVNGGVRCARAP